MMTLKADTLLDQSFPICQSNKACPWRRLCLTWTKHVYTDWFALQQTCLSYFLPVYARKSNLALDLQNCYTHNTTNLITLRKHKTFITLKKDDITKTISLKGCTQTFGTGLTQYCDMGHVATSGNLSGWIAVHVAQLRMTAQESGEWLAHISITALWMLMRQTEYRWVLQWLNEKQWGAGGGGESILQTRGSNTAVLNVATKSEVVPIPNQYGLGWTRAHSVILSAV